MRTARTKLGKSLALEVELDRDHRIQFDEPADNGGDDSAPMATEGLSASLAACTATTMRVYADRKGWDLTGLSLVVHTEYERYRPSRFEVDIDFPDHLEAEQIERLRVIAGKCPVHQTLANAVPIELTGS